MFLMISSSPRVWGWKLILARALHRLHASRISPGHSFTRFTPNRRDTPVTTRSQLAAALDDIAASYTSETPGITPDPLLGRRIHTLATRTRQRLRYGDPRLTAFEPHTDPAGHPWLPETVHDYLTGETNALWSFERWLTGLAQAAANADAPTTEELAELSADAAQMDALRQDGLHLTEAHDLDRPALDRWLDTLPDAEYPSGLRVHAHLLNARGTLTETAGR